MRLVVPRLNTDVGDEVGRVGGLRWVEAFGRRGAQPAGDDLRAVGQLFGQPRQLFGVEIDEELD